MTEWVPVALMRDIEAGSATATVVAGAPVALWRSGNGTVHAWADRCPHRGMRLSLGFVRGDRLICLYHGWQFDAGGSCRHIPAHPDLTPPAPARTVSYRVREAGSIVWVAPVPGDQDAPDDVPLVLDAATPACSVWIDGDPERVVARIAMLENDFVVTGSVARGMVDGIPVMAGVQAVSAERTALHIAVAGDNVCADIVASVVCWAYTLRDRAGITTKVVAS